MEGQAVLLIVEYEGGRQDVRRFGTWREAIRKREKLFHGRGVLKLTVTDGKHVKDTYTVAGLRREGVRDLETLVQWCSTRDAA